MTTLYRFTKVSEGLVVLAVLMPVAAAQAAMYEFTNIADTSGGYERFTLPSINDHGVVGFGVRTDNDDDYLIQTWDGENFSTMYHRQDFPRLAASYYGLFLNNVGDIAFSGRIVQGTTGIYVGGGGPLTTIADDSGDFSTFVSGGPFNDAGTVAFQMILDDGNLGIFTGDGGPIETLAHTNEGFDDFRGVDINELGATAYLARSGNTSYIFYQESGGPRTTLLQETVGAPFFLQYNFPAMNNSGQVVVAREYANLSSGVITSDLSIVSSTGTQEIANNAGPFSGFVNSAINEEGEVVFLAGLDDLRIGIFSGPDTIADAIVVEGDTLFGSQIEQVEFSGSMNEGGEFVFNYRLDNGIRGIALATPVPEPGMGFFLIAALIGLAVAGRR